jgi:UDP-glucose 4-epimerase
VRVFISGGAGFIGSHLCDAYVLQDDEVTILDNLSTGSPKNISHLEGKIKIIKGDIRNQELVESIIMKSDLVLHMAAALGVNNILQNPIESISTNFYGSEVILNAALKYEKRIIIASTSEIYGKNLKQPLKETDDRVIGPPQKLRWTYSDAKALEESIAYFLYLTKNLQVTTIRFFNTVGPRQTGEYGMVIPRFVQSAINNFPLNIFGDGTQSRVFCHVNDATKAIMRLAESNSSIGEVFNIGGREEIKILDLAKLIIKKTKSESTITYTKYGDAYSVGFEDMTRRVPDLTKIKNFIGWTPTINLNEIISDLVSFYTTKT